MGVIYKLKPEIIDFILEKKRAEPNLSCRGLSDLAEKKLQIKLSKSSVNAIIKHGGLSMPVGRRRKKRRRRPEALIKPQEEIKLIAPPVETPIEKPLEAAVEAPVESPVEIRQEAPLETECTGAILLKAADSLVGGSNEITKAIRSQLGSSAPDLLAKTEVLLYRSLGLDSKFTPDEISAYLNKLQELKALNSEIAQIISRVFQEVRSVKVSLTDGTIFYLDGQLHTVWSTPQIPYDFSTTIYNIKSYINKYFQKDTLLLLFMAPGYDMPTKEFFDLILSLDATEKGKQISKLTLYGNKIEELENIKLEESKKRFLIFGLWPWQFGQYRKVKSIGEFKPFYFEPLKKNLYITNVEIELLQPNINKKVTLIGCALKTSPNEKVGLIILTNLALENVQPENLANLYLSHWPNLGEAFQDFSRKIELFTYTASSQRFFSLEGLNLSSQPPTDIAGWLSAYLTALDLYVKWHFLPMGYEDKDFPTIKAQFYDLEAKLKQEKDYTQVTFKPPSDYPGLKDLEYAVRRVNEREIILENRRLWLLI